MEKSVGVQIPSLAPLSYNGIFEKSLREVTEMKREFNVVIEMDSEGYYVATVPELRGCHTQAKSLDKLMKRVKEAIELCMEVEGEPEKSTQFIGLQRIVV